MSAPSTTVRPRRAVLGLVTALVGTGLMVWGFVAGIDAAFAGRASTGYVVMFLAGAVLVLAALVFSIVLLVRGGSIMIRVLAAVTVVVTLLPLVAVVRLWLGV